MLSEKNAFVGRRVRFNGFKNRVLPYKLSLGTKGTVEVVFDWGFGTPVHVLWDDGQFIAVRIDEIEVL